MSGITTKASHQRADLRVSMALIRRGTFEIRDGLKTLETLLPGMHPSGNFTRLLMAIAEAADIAERSTLAIETECERVAKRKS
ncbi:MAG: hypothetical protein HY369_00495 [Candidatus Aenigmarchaeota archaeon]|nr:hypothetical protein [Candidatus Aenigmarchaeota archaeon]